MSAFSGRERRWGTGPVRQTMIANFAVTYRCDGRCRMCNIWRMETPERGEMGFRDVRRLFSDNADILGRVQSIQLTGGSPSSGVTYRSWSQRSTASSQPVPLDTDQRVAPGTVEDVAETLEAIHLGAQGISASMNGLGETHDHAWGVEKSFEAAADTLGCSLSEMSTETSISRGA